MDNVSDSEIAARDLLAELQDAVAAKDVDRAAEVFDDDVAIFGTGSANLDREQSFAYLRNVFAQDAAIRWEWTQVRPLVDDGAVLCFAVVGTVGFDDWTEE